MKVERIIKLELGKLNAQVPEKRLTLKAALVSNKPAVFTKGGGVHSFKKGELELLSKMLPEEDWEKLQLPIFISFEPSLGRGTAKIRGKIETAVVAQIIGKNKDDEMTVYRPEVAAIRRKLPTTTQYLFVG